MSGVVNSIQNQNGSVGAGQHRAKMKQLMSDVTNSINSNGSISKEDFEKAFVKNAPQGVSQDAAIKKADELFAKIDKGNDGKIDTAELQNFQATQKTAHQGHHRSMDAATGATMKSGSGKTAVNLEGNGTVFFATA